MTDLLRLPSRSGVTDAEVALSLPGDDLVPDATDVAVGDEIADRGPGDPVFRASVVDAPPALVWHSLRDRDNQHRWPADPNGPRVLPLSWALVPRAVPEGTRLHLRLRMRVKHPALATIGGLVDWLTIVWLFRGLRERVAG